MPRPAPEAPRTRLVLLLLAGFAFAGMCGTATYGYLDQHVASSLRAKIDLVEQHNRSLLAPQAR